MESSWAFDRSIAFIETAQRSTDLHELAASFEQMIREFGFEEYLAISLADPDHWPNDAIALNGYSEAWGERYSGERYFEVDPFLAKAQRDVMPFLWTEVRKAMTLSDRQKALMFDAANANHAVGMTVPVVVAGSYRTSVSVCADRHDLSEPVRHAVHLAAIYLVDATQRLRQRQRTLVMPSAEHPPAMSEPTDREAEVLKWLAAGKTAWEISEILNISERTVRFHIDNTKKKFGVATTMQAVVRALIHQHISG